MEENQIKISHDTSATDTYYIVTALLDKLGIKYEEYENYKKRKTP